MAGTGEREIPTRLRLGNARLGLLARVDVLDLRNEIERAAAGLIANDRTGKMSPDGRSVLPEITLLEVEGIDRARLQIVHRLPPDQQIVGMRDLEESQRLDLFACVAKHGGEGRIGLADATVETDNHDADRRILHGAAEAQLALGDLLAIPADPADRQGGEEQRARRHRHRDLQAEPQRFGAEIQARQQDRGRQHAQAGDEQRQPCMPKRFSAG